MPVSRRLLFAALAVVGVASTGLMAGRDPGGGEDPVRGAVKFLGGKQSADFDGTLQIGTAQGSTRDTRIRGKVGLPDRSLELLGNDAVTVIVTAIGDRVYESRGGMPSTYEPSPSPAGHSLNVWRPAELRRTLGSLEGVTVADRTIQGRVPLSALVTTPLPGQADVELTVDRRGRPERLQWQMDVDSARTVEIRGDVTYRGWTARKADIATPEEIENSPDVDEERLAAFGHGPVLAPARLPIGYQLTDLLLLEGDGVSCAKAELEYFQPDRYFGRYVLRAGGINAPRLSISMSPRSCTSEPVPAGTPFVAGAIRGTVTAHVQTEPDVEPFRFFYADVGTLRVKVDTNLPEGDVLAAIGSLAPIDLATQPVHQGRDIGDDDPLAILDSLVRYALPAA
jgi:hypothetical protein